MSLDVYKSSAGSGKTTTLVNEYLKIALKNPHSFRHILAITFTNKAAAEMKHRVLSSLKEFSEGKKSPLLDILQNHNYVDCIKEIVGKEFLVSSFGANIAKPGGIAMDLHTDQWWFPDPVNRNEKFLPPGSINRKKFNYKIKLKYNKSKNQMNRI